MAANNRFADKNTSLISILSSVHGQLRREQRDIDKRDLQRALKHGTRHRAWEGRWRVEYEGITFITDSSLCREITAYPSPLPEAELDASTLAASANTKRLLDQKPELSTSHTVIVVDNSGSMLSKKNDVHMYRDSQNAAFSMTALEFVAEQLLNDTAGNSDLVSLVKFDAIAKVEFSKEPIAWPVYNEILRHRNTQGFKSRQYEPQLDDLNGLSNYLPALKCAKELLNSGFHDKLALSLFFFSDGRSTDHLKLGVSVEESYKLMKEEISEMAATFGELLTVCMVGLGDVYDEFTPLKEMADAATAAGAKGSFERCERTANSISSAISSMVTSTTETRVALQEGGRKGFTERSDLTSEKFSFPKCKWEYFKIFDHYVYDPQEKCLVPRSALPLAAVHSSPEEAIERESAPPPYIAINRNYVGKGAERVAFRCRLTDDKTPNGFVFLDMVAKETKHDQRINERISFHQGFAETQDLASYLAFEFNKHLRGTPNYCPRTTPQMQFLSCSVLLLEDPSWHNGERGVLVEKMLDTDRFRWTKWNDNNGEVYGRNRTHIPIDVDFELKELEREKRQNLGAIVEDDEDSDDDASLSDVESDDSDDFVSGVDAAYNMGIDPSDYLREFIGILWIYFAYDSWLIQIFQCCIALEAFTHFTYRFTNRRVMVCDLQGVFNTDMIPPTIEMTDPAIHYASSRGRRCVYGRTDKGRSGMNAFFKTHKCTPVCKMLHLSARNMRWSRDWRQESAQSTNFKPT